MRTFLCPKYHPLIRHYLTHQTFLDIKRAAGYGEIEGNCHGLGTYFAYKTAVGQADFFDNQLKQISLLDPSKPIMDEKAHDFFTKIDLGQAPKDYNALKITHGSNRFQTQNIAVAMACFSKMEKNAVMHCATFSGIYTAANLSFMLALLQKMPNAFSLVLGSHNHAIACHHNPKKNWLFLDANQLPAKTISDNRVLAKNIHQAFNKHNDLIVMQSDLIVEKKHHNNSHAFFQKLKKTSEWKALHNPTNMQNQFNSDKNHWLHMAAEAGLLAEARALLTTGANPDVLYENSTALQLSCKNGFYTISVLLLAHKASPNLGEPTPLQDAVSNDDIKTSTLLLTAGANPNISSEENPPPLQTAVKNKNSLLVDLLLKHGANPNVGDPAVSLQAIKSGDISIAKLLVKHGAVTGKSLLSLSSNYENKKSRAISDEKPLVIK